MSSVIIEFCFVSRDMETLVEDASVELVGKGVIQNVGIVTSACHSTEINKNNDIVVVY